MSVLFGPPGGEPEDPDAAPQRPDPEAGPDAPGPSRRRRYAFTLGALGLLVLLIVFLPRSRATSASLPAGAWGRTIACLERDQTFRVVDARTGRVPDARTRGVTVRSTIHPYPLADVRDAGSAAAAAAAVRHDRLHELSRSDYRTFGRIVWAYPEDGDPPHVSADLGDQRLIAFCVRTPTRR
jgi:hypothetical protein